jgi:hypothetical protein
MITAADVREQVESEIDSLTPGQRIAIQIIDEAMVMSSFSRPTINLRLERLYQRKADELNAIVAAR